MTLHTSIAQRIATEVAARAQQVQAAIDLIDEGASVPFIARYRKEATGGLDDGQLRTLEERLYYLRELEARRAVILASVEEQGKLSPELRARIENAEDKARLEDLYLPFKPRRRTKAQIAREAGLEPLALALLANAALTPETEAQPYLKTAFTTPEGDNPGVADVKAALDGARQILMEHFAEDADLIGDIRQHFRDHAVLSAKVAEGKQEAGVKFADYFDYSEPYRSIPSHRALALFRARREEILQFGLRLQGEDEKPAWDAPLNACEARIAVRFDISNQGRPADAWLQDCVRWAWRVKISLSLETELSTDLRERAEAEAIRVFGMNLKDLLLAAPAGARATIGLDPGLRTGVKVAVVDHTGKVVETGTIFPHAPRNQWDASIIELAALCARHRVELIAIGNGTASRETDRLAMDLMKAHPDLTLHKLVVSEAGASVYSASDLAAREFPDLDVSLRGAVSIARRLQDPLAELVKIDPKAIGVGQYQHDVNQGRLARALDAIVEDCVNAVGVELNTASTALLTRVSGLTNSIAQNIVSHRDANGPFKNRTQLLSVPRLGEKTFQQAAGFLRIMHGDNPLDASCVHPEAYPVVERILADIQRDVKQLIGDGTCLRGIDPSRYTDARFGLPTVTDILKELEKPGRDPRPEFRTASFKDGVEALKDLQAGMVLEGVVTNVTNFGAFVDIGVHQDGLVHISAMSEKFIKDPREVVKAGDVVRVKVMEVDEKRRRVALSMKLNDAQAPGNKPRAARPASSPVASTRPGAKPRAANPAPQVASALALAMERARKK